MHLIVRARRAALSSMLLFASACAMAQSWPAKNVTMVVPWPPGGPSDIAARPLSKGLEDAFGKPFIIDNRAGAGGNVGSEMVARAVPDGHTLLVTASGPIVINQFIYKKMSFDGQRDFAPITNLLRVPQVLVVHPSVPAKNLQELLAYIRTQNGKFQWASAGNGTTQHLTGELFSSVAKLDMVHVPYKGTAPAITDLLGGHVPMMFDSTIAIVPQIKAGRVHPIAVSGAKRSPLLPDVPTFTELGFSAVESYAWYGLFAPAKTPESVINAINEATLKFMRGPEFQRVLDETGSEFVGEKPAAFAEFIKTEATKWGRIAKETGASID